MERLSAEINPWISAYLYYGETWQDFLIDGVLPFIHEIKSEKLVDKYFFIRYWEKGPHIRLRILPNNSAYTKRINSRLGEYFELYFKMNPTQRRKVPGDGDWYPNNSVQFIEYDPEIERYGGPSAIAIAETQFRASTDAVLSILKEAKNWDYQRALGAAIQLHVSFAHACGMSMEDTDGLFTMLYKNWMPTANHYQPNMRTSNNSVLENFKVQFNSQKETLVSSIGSLWEGLEEQADFDSKWLNHWIEDMRGVYQELKDAYKMVSQINPMVKTTEKMYLQNIYMSYIHMTNNRLGVLNLDEGYLGYLLAESLTLLISQKQSA